MGRELRILTATGGDGGTRIVAPTGADFKVRIAVVQVDSVNGIPTEPCACCGDDEVPQTCEGVAADCFVGDLVIHFVDFDVTDPDSGNTVHLSGITQSVDQVSPGFPQWERFEVHTAYSSECTEGDPTVSINVFIRCWECASGETVWYMTIQISSVDPEDCFSPIEINLIRYPLNGCEGAVGSWTIDPPAPGSCLEIDIGAGDPGWEVVTDHL